MDSTDVTLQISFVLLTIIPGHFLTEVARVEKLYLQAEDLFKKQGWIHREVEDKIKQLQEASKNLPTLD